MPKLRIGHLYPDLLNLYGDRGNMCALSKRCEWRNIDVEITEYCLEDKIDFDNIDILFLGGGSDREQLIVCNKLKEIKSSFKEYVENDGVVIAICGGYQLLGSYYQLQNERIQGLGVIDIYTELGSPRLIGNVAIKSDDDNIIVGFENHGGRTYIGDYQPLGRVLYGHGNNGVDKTEGVIYKNLLGTYLHGPLFPKNPELADEYISRALKIDKLEKLDQTIEDAARKAILDRILP